MEEANAAATEDGAENETLSGDRASENSGSSSAEDTADRVGVFCCRDCGEAFREEAAYSEHRLQHPQENCGLYLDDRLNGLDSDAANFCTLCSLSFVELSEFQSHMEKSHGRSSQKESGMQRNSGTAKQHIYECADCGKSYGVLGHFLNHQRSHRPASKSVFNDLEHLKKKPFQCESCGRNYSRASALDAHRRCHEEKLVKSRSRNSGDSVHGDEAVAENQTDETEKLFKCSCGKGFTALLRLKTHQRFSRKSQCTPEEMKEKPKKSCNEFYCSQCDKAFSGHIALFNHQRWHTNHSDDSAKRFPCEECGKEFMTLTFYYRHQRTAHSNETPAKSFHHQVCQLQKKAFECKDCGLKFSRASALHSHELHHTDVFRETEKEAQMRVSLLPQQNTSEGEKVERLEEKVETENVPITIVVEDDETDEEMESYEPGDFNVQVISASESEDEPVQDPNPDLELLCESDQEGLSISSTSLVLKPEMDLKIIQIDFEPVEDECSQTDDKTTAERFDCPDCYRWFTNANSLRVHRMWHSIRKRRQQVPGQSAEVHPCDTCGHESGSYAAHSSHIQKHKDLNTSSDALYQAEESEKKDMNHSKRKPFQCPDCMMSYSHAASLFSHMNNCSAQKKENISVTKKEYNPKKTLLGPKIYHCEQCGKGFWSLGAYAHHKQSQTDCADLRRRKGAGGSLHSVNGSPRSSLKVACPVCGRKFRHKGIMTLHMRKHENGNHKCELCNRSFRLFSSLLRHQVVHSDQLLPPPIKSFQHQVEQLKKNTYSCPDCGKLFSRAKALQFHMKSHGYETGHSPSSPGSTVKLEDLQCATCLAHFSNKASLRAHQKLCIKKDNQVVDYKTENDIKPPNNDSLYVGKQKSSEQVTVNTEVKNEMDTDELKIESPIDACSLENPNATDSKYKCKKCDRSFSVIGALNLHKRVHAGAHKSVAKTKPGASPTLKQPKQKGSSKGLFRCLECGRQFLTNSALGSHKRWHSEKTLPRSFLKEQFLNRCALQRQRASTPSQTESDGASARPEVSCPECDETFEEGPLLAAHYDDEHSASLEAAEHQIPEQPAVSVSTAPKPKTYQCPTCFLTFAKARGLRAHKWQVHSKRTKDRNKFARLESTGLSSGVKTYAAETVMSNVVVIKKRIPADPLPVKFISCLDCGKQCSGAGALIEHKKVCSVLPVKQEIQTPESMVDVPPPPPLPLSRLSEHTARCLFKCDKCGKAFQTEEQLGVHRSKAKTRPHCCALCCQGFWTESQLQQHLAWHDEVRCRLPNEVRFRLSAALTAKSLKDRCADGRGKTPAPPTPELDPDAPPPQSGSHKCQHCGKAFLSPAALHKHETRHCSNDSYRCSICPRTFSEIQDLIDHHQECIGDYKRHSDAPAAVSSGDTNGLTCLECGTTFCQETDLHQHYIEHAQGAFSKQESNNIVCQECGMKFTCLEFFTAHLHQHALREEEDDEEDEEAEMGDTWDPAEEKVSGGDLDNQDPDGGGNTSTSKLRQVHACTVCGKAYTYMSSFMKHLQLHEKPKIQPKSFHNMKQYECPECGMSFIRQARLLGHMRVHRKNEAPESDAPRCDQCNRYFRSVESWEAHVDYHKQNPFWCLSCAKGYRDEESLDRHLQNHDPKKFECDVCHKTFLLASHLTNHYSIHGETKPFQCSVCGKSFCHPGNLVAHRKKHLRCNPLAIKASADGEKETAKIFFPVRVKEEPETEMCSEISSQVKEVDAVKTESPGEDAEDQGFSDDSDCGEPMHSFNFSKPLVMPGSEPPDYIKTETAGSEAGSKTHREHKYWDWECTECDMGFDEVEKLHQHYIQHATGELPIPQFDMEG